MNRLLLIAAALAAFRAAAAPREIWLTPERRAQLKAVTSRPYVSKREALGDGTERLEWRNGSREWVTTQAVRRVAGAKARDPHGDAKREAAEAREQKRLLLQDVQTLGKKSKVTVGEIREIAVRHGGN
jgi:hypothetical protein